MTDHDARWGATIGEPIRRAPDEVYAFVVRPENLPRWAAGVGSGIRRRADRWVLETPTGEATIRFADDNDLGVLDHWITTPDGSEVYVPMRVVPNGTGSTVLFTLFQLPDMDDAAFSDDLQAVARDLRTLREVLEDGRT